VKTIRFPTVLAVLLACGGTAAQEGVEVASPNPLASLVLESFEATRSLPLFTPSRMPPFVPEPIPQTETVYTPPPPMPPALELVGIITSGSTEVALLRDLNTGQFHRLSASDQYEGWSLRFVDVRTVEFFNGEQVQTLTMFEQFDGLDGAMGLQPELAPAPMPEYLPPEPAPAPMPENLPPEPAPAPMPEYLPPDPNAVAPPE